MQHLRTCSDDEDFAVVGGCSDSSADTDELLGNVDWALAQGSDDYEQFGTIVRHAHPSSEPHEGPRQQGDEAPAPPRPTAFDPQDWMFDFARTGQGAQRAAPPLAAVNPAAVSAAAAQQAQRPAAAAVAAHQQQRQQQRQQLLGPRAQRAEQQLQQPQGTEQQRQQHDPATCTDHNSGQQQQQQQQSAALPGDLDARLDRLLLEFAAAGPPRGAPRARHARRPSSGSGSSGEGLGFAGGVPAVRVAYHSAGGGGGSSTSSAGDGGGGGGSVRFANMLPPQQENFPLLYSDMPAAAWLRAGAPAAAPAAAAPAQAPAPHAATPPREPAAALAASEAAVPALQPEEARLAATGAGEAPRPASAAGDGRGSGQAVATSVPTDPNDPFSFRRRPAGGTRALPAARDLAARHPGM